MKKALITGVTGQDGAYMSRLLLEKGYEVHGLKRRSSLFNTARIDDLYQDPQNSDRRYFLHYGDLTDGSSLNKLIYDIQPDEIYHLGAMSHVKVSFDMPEYTSNVIGQGTLRLLESIRLLGLDKKTRIINAASSEMYGNTPHIPQHERTPHYPQSPYAASKLFAYWMAINYRESYNMYCANAIMFNHESPLRGETFVTRKITMAVARIALGLQDLLYLGNLDSKRDWGHSEDYMRAMWLILQQEQPDDFVIATGRSYSVREMLITAFENIGVQLRFEGSGVEEKAFVVSSTDPRYPMTQGKQVMAIDPRYFRPSEVHNLCGDATKAKQELGWEPHYTFQSLISEMVAADIELFSAGQNLPSKNYNRP